MAKRKRATRSVKRSSTLILAAPKPRNPILQAAAVGKIKLGTAKHEKSEGALRRAQKIALLKAAPA